MILGLQELIEDFIAEGKTRQEAVKLARAELEKRLEVLNKNKKDGRYGSSGKI